MIDTSQKFRAQKILYKYMELWIILKFRVELKRELKAGLRE